MLFTACACRKELDLIEKNLFTFLNDSLKLSFKANKRKTILAHYCGFETYNHAKPVFDALPSVLPSEYKGKEFRTIAELVLAVEDRTGDVSAVSRHLLAFMDSELSLTFNEMGKEHWLYNHFVLALGDVNLGNHNNKSGKQIEDELSTDSYKLGADSSSEGLDKSNEVYALHDYQKKAMQGLVERVKPEAIDYHANTVDEQLSASNLFEIQSRSRLNRAVPDTVKFHMITDDLTSMKIFPSEHITISASMNTGMSMFTALNDKSAGNVIVLGDGEQPNLVKLFKTHKRIVTIPATLTYKSTNLPLISLQVPLSATMESPKKLVIISPPSLMYNYKKQLGDGFGITDVNVVKSSKEFNGFNSQVTVISSHLFAKLELSRGECKDTIAYQDFYPSNTSPMSKTQMNVIRNMDKFENSWVDVDSMASLSTAFTRDRHKLGKLKATILSSSDVGYQSSQQSSLTEEGEQISRNGYVEAFKHYIDEAFFNAGIRMYVEGRYSN